LAGIVPSGDLLGPPIVRAPPASVARPAPEETSMTDRSDFTDEQWHAITDAPVAIMLAVAMVGDHGPISMVKESAAGAKVMAAPPHAGPADALIAAIVPDAKDKQARHDAKEHKGATPDEIVAGLVGDVEAASKALDHIPAAEAAQVRQWFLDIATAVAGASKGVKPSEQELLDRLASLLGLS
jgi:hypothetical protein